MLEATDTELGVWSRVTGRKELKTTKKENLLISLSQNLLNKRMNKLIYYI